MKRDELVSYLDEYLQVKTIQDRSNNGLQVEGADQVTQVAFAVDASLAAFEGAQAAGAQMLVVHHGLFWGEPVLLTGIHRQRVAQLVAADLSLYAAHLPLDFHTTIGNNATLARWLNLKETGDFGEYKGEPAGVAGRLPKTQTLDQFVAHVEDLLGEPTVKVWPFGPRDVQRVGIVSGGAAFLLEQAAEAEVDVYLTGEMSHSHYHQAQELGLNVVFGGHYATETAGLKALAQHLVDQFGLETVFLDLPTGA
ncbi:MAG: Nif3-like dinuclear metal center hexameric protein [Anaerolineae bacterium]|jgi:dinuclear metal center YbgI/SA1388 family protein